MTDPPRTISELLSGREGLRVIGDIHGAAAAFRKAVQGARAKNYAVLSLGDIIDRGPDSPGTIRQMIDLWEQGDGDLVPGNHDDKFRRFQDGAKITLGSGGLGQTIEQLQADPEGDALARRFAAGIAIRPVWRVQGRMLFVHGGFDPAMRDHHPVPTVTDRGTAGKLVSRALYGETSGAVTAKGHPVRTYAWVDTIPAGMTVFIGHDVISLTEIARRRGALGGIAVHVDTGIDRGGKLSLVDIPAADFNP